MNPQRVITLGELADYTGLRRTQIEALIAAGKFPRPVKMSVRRRAWLASEVAAWQQARIAEREATTPITSQSRGGHE